MLDSGEKKVGGDDIGLAAWPNQALEFFDENQIVYLFKNMQRPLHEFTINP